MGDSPGKFNTLTFEMFTIKDLHTGSLFSNRRKSLEEAG